MAIRKNARALTIEDALRELQDRIRRLESSDTKRFGRWTVSMDSAGNLVATPDGGAPTVLAP